MVKFMNKIPAGTFLIPMLISALLYTFWPDLMSIGGVTEAFLGGGHMDFVIGLVTFISGIGIEVKSLGKLFKRHGVLMIAKLILVVVLSLGYMALFGQAGIFGISALAFTVVLSSVNSALYISLVTDYGDKVDQGAFGIIGLFSIPAVPVFVYALQGSGGINLMPVLTTLIPLILGIILGNLDPDFRVLFKNGIGVLIPIIGWKIGQSMNLLDGLQEVFVGLILALLFYVLMSPLIVLDKKVLKYDGVVPTSMNAVAAMASSYPIIVAQSNPTLAPFVGSATAQVLAVSLITVVVTPILVKKMYEKEHGE